MQTPDHGSRQRNRQHGKHHVQQRGNQLNPRNQGREQTAFRKRGDSRHGQPRNPHSGKTSCSSPFPARPSKRHHALMTRIQYFFLLQPESAPPGSDPGSGRTEGSPSSSMTVMAGIKEARGLQSPPGTFRTKVRLDRRPRLRARNKSTRSTGPLEEPSIAWYSYRSLIGTLTWIPSRD